MAYRRQGPFEEKSTMGETKGETGWFVWFVIAVASVILVFVLACPVNGQTMPTPVPAPTQATDAATRIADAAQPSTVLLSGETTCLTEAAKILKPKDAAKFCLATREQEVKRETKLANEAADASKNSRPSNPCSSWFTSPSACGGYGYGGVYQSSAGSGYYSGTVHTTGGGYVQPYGASGYGAGQIIQPQYYGGDGTGVTPYGASPGGGQIPPSPQYRSGGGDKVTPYQPPR